MWPNASRPARRSAFALGLFSVLVLVGYLLPMPWTDFTCNTLWDWFELVLLPLVIASASAWLRPVT
jgi:hypothetical protein